jgi:hypothetical protein
VRVVTKFCVTVHGTFAPDATWIEPNSVFCRTVSKESGAEVIAFRWSGGNSRRDRLAAAEALRSTVDDLVLQHPDASIWLIGHSHGGNVLRYAYANDCPERIDGFVFLGTPFLEVFPWNLRKLRKTFSATFILSLLTLIPAAIMMNFTLMRSSTSPPRLGDPMEAAAEASVRVILFLLPLLGLFASAALALAGLATPALRRRQSAMMKALRPKLRVRPLDVVIYVPADEARSWLLALDLLSTAAAKGLQHLIDVNSTALRQMRRFRRLFVIATCIYILGFGAMFGFVYTGPITEWFGPLFLGMRAAFALAPLGMLPSMLPLLTISATMVGFPFFAVGGLMFSTALRSSSIAFGSEGFVDYLLLLPRVERHLRRREARSTVLVQAAPFRGARLKHSGYYDDPAVAAAVAAAIAGAEVDVERKPIEAPRSRWRTLTAHLALRLAANLYWIPILLIVVPAIFVTGATLYGLLKALRLV